MTQAAGAVRELDLVLLGATGFTGRLTAHELAARVRGTRLRWGIAGRDTDRLRALAAELGGTDGDGPSVLRADVTDAASLSELASRTRVVATTVGPYARFGLPVARACADEGTHYADITGEEGYVRTLEHEVDATARANGATMVVCCGFDSVPHDLGVRFLVSHLPDDADVVVRGYVRAKGRMSGGTARTALDTLSGAAVVPDRVATAPDDARPVERLRLGVHRPERLGGWAVPMPTVDPMIVLRSARVLPGYGELFVYGHFAHLRRTATLAAGGLALGTAALAARTRPGRAALERLLPSPGEGPDAATRAAGRFTVLLVATAHGRHEDDDVHAIARVRGGDPGYGETSRMLAEAALTLASDERPDVTGVVTPAVGLGAPYQRRLEAGGMRFELLERTP